MPRIFVGIGSNVERHRSIRGGVRELGEKFGELDLSNVYECPAVGFRGKSFLNLVASFDSDAGIGDLNKDLKVIEGLYGRVSGAEKFASRTLDIDILLYGDLIHHVGRIDVPRYEIRRYAFVLRPLSEMVPDQLHPELGISYRQMWQEFDDSEQPTTLYPFDFTDSETDA